MKVCNLVDNMELNIFKSKNVKTPSKAWDAAGWDFFIPENLSIFDFTKDANSYLDSSIVVDKSVTYFVPLYFYLTSSRTVGEFKVQLCLKWNGVLKNWAFHIIDVNNDDNKYIKFEEIDNTIMKWITEETTIISRIEIFAHSSILIPSGIHVNLPENVFLKAENKSGIGSKRRLSVLASVIDTDYMGEIHINLANVSNNSVIIKAGEKIIQFVPYFQPYMKEAVEFDSLDKLYKNKKSIRGKGGFGSSGEK